MKHRLNEGPPKAAARAGFSVAKGPPCRCALTEPCCIFHWRTKSVSRV